VDGTRATVADMEPEDTAAVLVDTVVPTADTVEDGAETSRPADMAAMELAPAVDTGAELVDTVEPTAATVVMEVALPADTAATEETWAEVKCAEDVEAAWAVAAEAEEGADAALPTKRCWVG